MKYFLSRMICFVFVMIVSQRSFSEDIVTEVLEHWNYVLQNYVDDEGRTDFRALANDRQALDQYVEFVANISPKNNPELFQNTDHVLAYHINTYNALAMHGVIERGIPEGFNSFFKRASFFKFHKVMIGGETTSLYDYENKVIRPLGEARVHFVLNCMVRDCPRLPREPFLADTLETQLESASREFFSKDKHIRIDHDKKQLWLSEILDFYTEDFVGKNRSQLLIDYVNDFIDEPVPEDYRVKFIDYDWTINQQP